MEKSINLAWEAILVSACRKERMSELVHVFQNNFVHLLFCQLPVVFNNFMSQMPSRFKFQALLWVYFFLEGGINQWHPFPKPALFCNLELLSYPLSSRCRRMEIIDEEKEADWIKVAPDFLPSSPS